MDIKAQEQKFYYDKNEYLTYIKKGSGPTALICLHGFGASKNSWDDIYPLFDTSKYTLYLIDLKGFGNSSKPNDNKYSLKNNEEIITQFINSNVTNNYILIGHSYGGGISLLLTNSLKLDHKPIALILIASAAYNTGTPFFIRYLRTPILNQLIYLVSTPKIRANFTLKHIFAKANLSSKIVNRYIYSYTGKNKKYTYIKSAQQIRPVNYEELIASYSNIKIPTIIIWGDHDEVISINQGKLLSKQITSSSLKIIENCGHVPQEEKPNETFEIISKFLLNLSI